LWFSNSAKVDHFRKAPRRPDEILPSLSGTAANKAASFITLAGAASFVAVGLFYEGKASWVAA
jgi:hypothetical protein